MDAPVKLSAVLGILNDDGVLETVLLWRGLFGNEHVELCDMEDELLFRINRDFFPVDIDAVNEEYMQIGEPLIGLALWIQSFSILWEDGCSIDAWEFGRCVGYPLYGLLMECSAEAFDVDAFPDKATAYLGAHGIFLPKEAGDVTCCYEEMITVLERLKPPLDGAAFVLKCLCRKSENPFIDYSPYDQDSAFDYMYGFTVDDINSLKRAYDEIRPEVERFEAYKAWFEATSNAEDIVLRAVVGAVFGTEVFGDDDLG